ncbi:hypothetical protein Barb6_03248 [Bacteroidales bacterium Barb6]|nr:hypothetical protein Barb6_03248 [Bacteroidales bacterium Barb6]
MDMYIEMLDRKTRKTMTHEGCIEYCRGYNDATSEATERAKTCKKYMSDIIDRVFANL